MTNLSVSLKSLGWSEDLVAAVEAVSKKVNEGAISAPTIDSTDYLVSMNYDSATVRLSAENFGDGTQLILKK